MVIRWAQPNFPKRKPAPSSTPRQIGKSLPSFFLAWFENCFAISLGCIACGGFDWGTVHNSRGESFFCLVLTVAQGGGGGGTLGEWDEISTVIWCKAVWTGFQRSQPRAARWGRGWLGTRGVVGGFLILGGGGEESWGWRIVVRMAYRREDGILTMTWLLWQGHTGSSGVEATLAPNADVDPVSIKSLGRRRPSAASRQCVVWVCAHPRVRCAECVRNDYDRMMILKHIEWEIWTWSTVDVT